LIIGNGFLANAFNNRMGENLVIFASGVSDSACTEESSFLREEQLLLDAIADYQDKCIIYFGSCGVISQELLRFPYYRHKQKMEQIICSTHPQYLIFRLPQVIGKSRNNKTLVNNFFDSILDGKEIMIHRLSKRFFIDIDHVVLFVNHVYSKLSLKNKIINIACPQEYTALELLQVIESLTGLSAKYQLIDAGSSYCIDTSVFANEASILQIELSENYLLHAIQKHYVPKLSI
jgi:UDP-2-acetamido-2,6-beta-L-arabino-hexul-4-ose reductase